MDAARRRIRVRNTKFRGAKLECQDVKRYKDHVNSFDTVVTNHSGAPVVRHVRVKVSEGVDVGKSHLLERGSLILGSHPEVDFVLKDKKVSRRHVELQLVHDGIRVKDLDSRNGVSVHSLKVKDAVVAVGSVIKVGDTFIQLSAVEKAATIDAQNRFGSLRTQSPSLSKVFGLLARASLSNCTILLEGETGVGKDVLAKTIHDESKREGPRIVFDCSAIPATLIASELFGHKKGAFTGASTDRAGVFEEAAGGTVFLDEIGELPLDLQPMLLRALENREIRRVGEAKSRSIDVRVVAATHRELKKEVEAGRFREDLYYRLAVVRVEIPPLRKRLADIPILVDTLLKRFGTNAQLSVSDLALMQSYDWPGNVRELKNVLEKSAALSMPGAFTLLAPQSDDDVGANIDEKAVDFGDDARPYKEAKNDLLRRFEEHYIRQLVERHDGNIAAASRDAGIDRNYIYRLMKRYGIERK